MITDWTLDSEGVDPLSCCCLPEMDGCNNHAVGCLLSCLSFLLRLSRSPFSLLLLPLALPLLRIWLLSSCHLRNEVQNETQSRIESLTEEFMILESQNPSFNALYVVQKRRTPDIDGINAQSGMQQNNWLCQEKKGDIWHGSGNKC